MNVLSLFDGLSVGKLALDSAGIKVDNYYASEINKPVINLIAQRHPSIVQLGDVKDWATWSLPKIDLLIGGSPCQDLSVCSGQGKGLAGAKSGLFWQYVKVLNAVQPTWFLLENVKMNKVSRDIITQELGVQPVEIDSADYSPQVRKRLYWTNIPIEPKPLNGMNFISPKTLYKLAAKDLHPVSLPAQYKILNRYIDPNSTTVHTNTALLYNYWNDRRFDLKAPTLTTYSGSWSAKVGLVIPYSKYPDGLRFYKVNRYIFEYLQTLPIGYTNSLTRTEAFTALGNCWTKNVIAHIFKGLQP